MTTLYKTNKNKSIQSWTIQTLDDSFIVTFGQVGGAMQVVSTKCYSMNVGKSNETTPEQQAVLEMEALITKKKKSGYSVDPEAPVTVQLPMKVKSYQDQRKNVVLPAYSTPKLNGINGIFRRIESNLVLTSRGGEIYPAIQHLDTLIHSAMDQLNSNELNVELYIHGMALQDINAAVTKPNNDSPLLSACIFDICDSTEDYEIRRKTLLSHMNFNYELPSSVCALIGKLCSTHEDIERHYNECMALGLEGTVIKNLSGLYEHNVRSSQQFKYKKALDAEFKITGFELDKRNHPVFILATAKGAKFKAKPKGTHEFLESVVPQSYVGQWATVEYETLSKDLVPLKPIFIGLRQCDAAGKPLI